MKITIERLNDLERCTIGRLSIDGEQLCYTLEDKIREKKIEGHTAIPAGTYKVIIDHSVRFDRDLPHILDVPGFVGVRIHPGNTDLDTEGCILVGLDWASGDFIGRSREAFTMLMDRIKGAGEIELEIS